MKGTLIRRRCLCGFMFKCLLIGTFFLLYSSTSILFRDLFFSFRSFPRATMFKIATSLCSISRHFTVAIIRLDIASGVFSSKRPLVANM